MKLFIIDWTKDETTPLVEFCRKTAKVTGYELHDGAEAYKKTAQAKPDAIVINYAVRPSNGRKTAEQIHARKATAGIPIYFIDGSEDENEKVENIGICLSTEELKDLLEI